MDDLSSVNNEEKRIEALKLYDILDTVPEQEFDDLTQLASQICKTPIALISLIDENRQWFKSKVGLEVPETSRNISFCTHAINSDEIFEVPDPLSDDRFSENPLVTGYPSIRFYAGAPLINKEGYRIGTLCVIDSEPHIIDDQQKNSLRILARSVISLMELRKEKREAELYRRALDEVCMVASLDAQFRYQYANDKFLELAQLPFSEIQGKRNTEIQLIDVTPDESRKIYEALTEKRMYKGKIKNQNRKGTFSWSNLTVIPVLNKDNEMVRLLSLRNDTTTEEVMLERLQEAETIAQIGNWELNMINNERVWSRGVYNLLGYEYKPGDTNVPTILDLVNPEDRIRISEAFKEITDSGDATGHIDAELVTVTGKQKYISISVKKRFNALGELQSMYGTVQDITERKQAEKAIQESETKYRSLVEESSQMSYTTDETGSVNYASARLKKTLGYDDVDIIGSRFPFIYDDEWRKKTIVFYVQQLEKNIEETTFLFPVKTIEGYKIWVEQNAMLIHTNGQVTGFRCVLHDVTERVNIQEVMEEATRLAEEAKEMQQNFLGKMSHEIRTPMNGVIGMANLLSDTPLSEMQKEYVDGIRESGVNMLRIINDILDVTKIQAGKMTFEETEFEPAQLVSNVVFNFKSIADEKDIIIASHVDSKIPATLVADALRLNQILLNLVGNAVKFTEQGSVIISAKQKAVTDNKVTIEFKITDTGIGIARDKVDTVFESFAQAENDTTRKYGGTGLGLTIVKQLVEQQGGVISVASTPGVGTTFAFTYNCTLNDAAAKVAAEVEVKKSAGSFNGVQILLVEDNLMNQKVAKYTLQNWGIMVTVADRGFKAIDLLKTEKYDLILMDIQMPQMNGFQTTEVIRRDLKRETPIVAMTASAMRGEKEKCVAAGMNDYISKPFDPKELFEVIAKYVEVRSEDDKTAIDMEYLKLLLNNDIPLIKEILQIYITKTPDVLDEISKLVKEKKYADLHSEIHSLKNSVGMFGTGRLYEMITDIEIDLLDKSPSSGIIAAIGKVKERVLSSVEEAKEVLKKI